MPGELSALVKISLAKWNRSVSMRMRIAGFCPPMVENAEMILVTHPFGNANVRALMETLSQAGLLERFVTTLGWSKSSYPYLSDHIRGKLRRNYALPAE